MDPSLNQTSWSLVFSLNFAVTLKILKIQSFNFSNWYWARDHTALVLQYTILKRKAPKFRNIKKCTKWSFPLGTSLGWDWGSHVQKESFSRLGKVKGGAASAWCLQYTGSAAIITRVYFWLYIMIVVNPVS